jgi:hypothetical protein
MAEFPEDLSDINRDLVDVDYILVNKLKAALSRVLTYAKAGFFASSEIGAALTDLDHLVGYDESASNGQRKSLTTRIYDYLLAKVPIDVGSWTPSYSSPANLSSPTNLASHYIRVGNRWAWVTYMQFTRSSATLAKTVIMSLPSFITNNFAATGDCIGAGSYATNNDVTASNVFVNANVGAMTATIQVYDTASSGTRGFIIAGIGIVP